MRGPGLAALLGLWAALGGCDGCAERPSPRPTPTADEPLRIAAGGDRVCAVAGARLSCWRLDGTRLGVPELGEVADVAVGSARVCAHVGTGEVACWGEGEPETRLPADLTELALGEHHACGRTRSGEARCWGDNRQGQLGDGTTEARVEPVAVVDLGAVRSLAVGAAHACALTHSGEVRCWGGFPQLEDVPRVPATADEVLQQARQLPPPITSPRSVEVDALAIAAGPSDTCAVLRDGSLACWRGYVSDTVQPEVVPWPADATQVAMGGFGRCALRRSGAVVCWDYEAGEGRMAAPTVVRGIEDAVEIAVADAGACARIRDERIVCFGGDGRIVTLGSDAESR